MEKYKLWFDNKDVGYVTMEKRGLYYYFVCICNMPAEIDFRVRVHCGELVTDLGICVPENGSYTLRKQVPIKYVGTGDLKFYIGKEKQSDNKLILLQADKPFSAIDKLETAKLVHQNGEYYIELS